MDNEQFQFGKCENGRTPSSRLLFQNFHMWKMALEIQNESVLKRRASALVSPPLRRIERLSVCFCFYDLLLLFCVFITSSGLIWCGVIYLPRAGAEIDHYFSSWAAQTHSSGTMKNGSGSNYARSAPRLYNATCGDAGEFVRGCQIFLEKFPRSPGSSLTLCFHREREREMYWVFNEDSSLCDHNSFCIMYALWICIIKLMRVTVSSNTLTVLISAL